MVPETSVILKQLTRMIVREYINFISAVLMFCNDTNYHWLSHSCRTNKLIDLHTVINSAVCLPVFSSYRQTTRHCPYVLTHSLPSKRFPVQNQTTTCENSNKETSLGRFYFLVLFSSVQLNIIFILY